MLVHLNWTGNYAETSAAVIIVTLFELDLSFKAIVHLI